MSSLNIKLSKEELADLAIMARKQGITVEEYVKLFIKGKLGGSARATTRASKVISDPSL